MRLVILNLRFKNICSFGNNWTELNFKNGTVGLIIGRNGTGKSTFYEALFFGLYGKPFRKINKDGLVNTTNGKGALVEVELLADDLPIKIVRGIKPNTFEIYVNGVLKNQDASAWDYQGWLEQTVLRMDERTFRQLVVLGSTSFVPFMMLKTWERRQVIEDILCLGVFTTMLNVVKKRISAEALKRTDTTRAIDYQSQELKNSRSHLSSLTSVVQSSSSALYSQLDDYEKERISLKTRISELNDELNKFDIESLTNDYNSALERVKRCDSIVRGIKSAIQKIQTDLNWIQLNDYCPTCHQDINAEFKNEFATSSSAALKEKEDGLDKLVGIKTDIEEKLKSKETDLQRYKETKKLTSDLINRLSTVNDSISKLNANIEKIESDNSDAIEAVKRSITDIQLKVESFMSQLEMINTLITDLNDMDSFLRDSGVKSKIISEHIPLINFIVKKYLDILDFPIQMSFNDDFSESIRSRIREEFMYGNLSAGERMRIDLALLFTWREITRLSNSASCNLLILDEIGDSSLDADGFDSFMKILMSDRDNQCVLVISHKPHTISNLVDFVIEVGKPNEFSRIESHTVNDHQEILV